MPVNLSPNSHPALIALIGFDLDILDLAESCGCIVEGYFDQEDRGRIRHLGDDLEGKKYTGNTVFGLQSPAIRQKIWPNYADKMTSLISPTAHVSSSASVNIGATVHHGAIIFPEAEIGKAVQIHAGVFVHHESIIGDFSTLSPKALILGRVKIGHGVFVGAGAIIKENIVIGDGSVIGAGAVVVENVAPGETVIGVPARPIAPS